MRDRATQRRTQSSCEFLTRCVFSQPIAYQIVWLNLVVAGSSISNVLMSPVRSRLETTEL